MIENGEDEDYIKVFCHHVNNFQDIIQSKKNRNAKTKNFNKKEL
jgi:flavodoxin